MATRQVDPLRRLGDALRERRTEMAISQYELARQAGMHRTFVAGVERGERNVSVLTLRRITEALETTIEDIFRRAGL